MSQTTEFDPVSDLGREAVIAGAKPRFDTVLKVLQALGVQTQAHPVPQQP